MSENVESNDSVDLKGKETEDIVGWLNQLNIRRPIKRLHRDLSDGKILAEVINIFYPKLVEMHNYSSRFSFTTKMENWKLLNHRVLRKLSIRLDEKTMVDICNCTPGIIEKVLTDVRDKIKKDEEKRRMENDDQTSSDGSWYDVGAIDNDADIMIIPIRKRCAGDSVEIFKKKVISYDCYETLKNESLEKSEAIDILKQKVIHLENMLKTKDVHIHELQKTISRKSQRSKKNELSLIDIKPETLVSLLDLSMMEDDLTKENIHKIKEPDISTESMSDLITFIDS